MRKKKVNNLTMKIISIFFAIILWSYVMSEVNPIITKEIPNVNVKLLGVEKLEQSNLVLMEPNDATIAVKISGRRNEIFNITEKDIIAQAEVSGYQEGVYKVPIEVIQPPNVEKIEDFTPKHIPFMFDMIIEKQIPVTLNIKGRPKYGYDVGEWSIRPSTVLIRGPRTRVNSVSKVIASIDVSNLDEDMITSVPITILDANDKEVIGIEKEPNVVDVTIPILKLRSVSIEPVIEGNMPNNYNIINISSYPKIITVKGYEEDIYAFDTIKTTPVDISSATDTFQNQVELILPDGINVDDELLNPVVKIEIEKDKEKILKYSINDIQFKNLNRNLTIDEGQNQEVLIKVKGLESAVNKLSSYDIKIFTDASELKQGEHELNIEVQKPDDIKILNITPDKINVIFVEVNTEANTEVNNEVDVGE